MRLKLLIVLLLATACGGNLSDEQRKKLRDRMKQDEIKHVTEGELMAAALAYGRSVSSILEKRDPSLVNKSLVDSLESAFDSKISSIQPGDSLLLAVESQLIEAYTSSAGSVGAIDDVQKLGNDSLIYTKPIMHERPDGSVEFMRALSIHMPVKKVVLSIED
jgi:hypothetical protein